MKHYEIESVTPTLRVNWNGKLQPIQDTIMDDIVTGLWAGIEDMHYDNLAEKYDKSNLCYNDDPNWNYF